MEARGSLNGHEKWSNSWKIRDLFWDLLFAAVKEGFGAPRGGSREGFGRPRGGFWERFGGVRGAFGGPTGAWHVGNAWTFRHLGPGWLRGTVRGGCSLDSGKAS